MHSTKTQLRTKILATRQSATSKTRAGEADLLASQLAGFVDPGQTVCAHVPVGSEPGSLELIDVLVRRDVTVLLPVARQGPDGTPLPLQWARYSPGELVEAPYSLREPTQPWLPAHALAEAAVVVVPALAVDRQGVRLGRGAGFYDRTLRLADPGAALIAVVRDDELVDHLPSEQHDVPMTHALTPRAGVVGLGL